MNVNIPAAVKRLRMIAGPNGSGKSTILNQLRETHPEWLGVTVNADEIEKTLKAGGLPLDAFDIRITADLQERLQHCIANSGRSEKAGARADVIAQTLTLDRAELRIPRELVNSQIAGAVADFIREDLLEQGATFTFETVMSHPGKVRFLQQAQQAGYRTYLYFVATGSPETNIRRVEQRVLEGGHPVDDADVRRRYERGLRLLMEACSFATRAYIFDNTGDEHLLIAEIDEQGDLEYHVDEVPAWVADALDF